MLKILPPAGEDILDFLNNNLKNPNMDYLSLLYLCWMGSLGNIVPEDHEDAKLEKALLPEVRRKKNGKNNLLQHLYGYGKPVSDLLSS